MCLCSKNLLVPFLSLLFFTVSIYSLKLIPSSDPFISSSNPSIGITYSRHPTSDLPRPDQVVTTLQSLGVTRARVLHPDPNLVGAFSYSGISLLLSIPNTHIRAIAANPSAATKWLNSHVFPFYPRAHITTISVGNDVITSNPELSGFLLRAMQNIYFALQEVGFGKISVSTTHSFDIITTPFPPSAAEFKNPVAEWIMKPILDFITTTNSSFLINAYPYKLYRSYPEIPIGYALFEKHPFNYRIDPATGVPYQNLFDVMVDAAISAMAAAGHKGIPVIVTETGWPSDGDVTEPEANKQCARMYSVGLIMHLMKGVGTPLRREGATETYLFELFDAKTKQGPGSDRNWGILYPNMTMKFGDGFSGSDRYRGACLTQMVVTFCMMFAFLL
ncbi:glucan endo-1,3-beta-glucosidase 11-like [Magnolia sinica]|uniref:glucan endo-1,3-beta-glucosidase 11-like n=1 Tax=Magnolia sinica TaxID=86752 RepID=UPI0026584D02|nr:glucan endo-1,3-beta-glucosidase 11-like [Magnolia sinica]